VAEGVQTILRREQYPAPYEALQAVTRGKPVDEAAMRAFIASLDVSAVRSELGALTPRGVG
jgi:adenylosuccinate lyase